MLFNNLTTERRASLIVKNSRFYIEIAKFVQAYTTIVKNPNEFLAEINEPFIDAKKQVCISGFICHFHSYGIITFL